MSDEECDHEYYETATQFLPSITPASMMQMQLAQEKNLSAVHFLGRTYYPLRDDEVRRRDERSLFWFTYRCDFPTIVPYGISTDAGWGCMLRSAQMMLAQTLRLHYKGREWRPPTGIAQQKEDPFLRSILTWFADFPSKDDCRYSLHNMVATGLSKYETLPGEWYGPGTACYVLRDLCQLHEHQAETSQLNGSDAALSRPMFRVHIASQGTVYKDTVEDLMTRDGRKNNPEQDTDQDLPSHPLDPDYEPKEETKTSWDTSLLILIPLRLGLKSFNETYAPSLAHSFSLRQSVGALGGRPRGARWFCGAASDGSRLYGLDPHTVQNAPKLRKVRNGSTVVALTDEYVRSVHCANPEAIQFNRVDPSLSIGFYCQDRADFEHLCNAVQQRSKSYASQKSVPELFTVMDVVPDYSADVSSAMTDMMLPTNGEHIDACIDSFAADEEEADLSEEDEYVFL